MKPTTLAIILSLLALLSSAVTEFQIHSLLTLDERIVKVLQEYAPN